MNVLINKETGVFVGQCGLLVQQVEGEECLEIGFSILPKHWNKGYASEAAIKCKELAFERNYADFIISIVHVDNVAPERVTPKKWNEIRKENRGLQRNAGEYIWSNQRGTLLIIWC